MELSPVRHHWAQYIARPDFLFYISVIALSILENVIDLNISSCTKLKSDITCLKKLEKLNIYNCDNIIYNFNYLNNLKNVIIDCVFYNKNKHNLNKYFNKENIKHCCLSDNKKYCFTCNKCIETTKIYYM